MKVYFPQRVRGKNIKTSFPWSFPLSRNKRIRAKLDISGPLPYKCLPQALKMHQKERRAVTCKAEMFDSTQIINMRLSLWQVSV